MLKYFLQFELAWVALLGLPVLFPGLLIPLTWHPLVVAALFLFWPLRWISHLNNPNLRRVGDITKQSVWRRLFLPPRSPLTLSVLLMVAVGAVGITVAANLATAWNAAGFLFYGIVLFVALTNRPDPRRDFWLAPALLMGLGLLLSLVAPFVVRWKPEFRLFYLPLYTQLQAFSGSVGESIHANVLTGALVIAFPFWMVVAGWLFTQAAVAQYPLLVQWYVRWSARVGAVAIVLWLAAIIVLAQSRGGYLAVMASLAAIVVWNRPKLLWWSPPVALLGVAILAWVGTDRLLGQLGTEGSLGGWDVRLDIWTNSLRAIADFPLTGIGIGTFTTVMPLLYPLKYDIAGYPHAHNLVLQVGVDGGISGLVVWSSLQIMIAVLLLGEWRRLRSNASPQPPTVAAPKQALHTSLAAGAAGAFIALQVHGLLDAATWGVKLAFVPWLLYAAIVVLVIDVYPALGENNATTLRQ